MRVAHRGIPQLTAAGTMSQAHVDELFFLFGYDPAHWRSLRRRGLFDCHSGVRLIQAAGYTPGSRCSHQFAAPGCAGRFPVVVSPLMHVPARRGTEDGECRRTRTGLGGPAGHRDRAATAVLVRDEALTSDPQPRGVAGVGGGWRTEPPSSLGHDIVREIADPGEPRTR